MCRTIGFIGFRKNSDYNLRDTITINKRRDTFIKGSRSYMENKRILLFVLNL